MIACSASASRKACARAILRRLERQHVIFFVGKHVLAELRAERREALVYFSEPRLGPGREARAVAHERDVIELQHARLLGRQPRGVVSGPHGLDALEEGFVEIDLASRPREDWRDFALDRLERVIAV